MDALISLGGGGLDLAAPQKNVADPWSASWAGWRLPACSWSEITTVCTYFVAVVWRSSWQTYLKDDAHHDATKFFSAD